jgi:transposase
MSQSPIDIPDDLQACQALIAQLSITVDDLNAKYKNALNEIAEQQLTINKLIQQAWGKRRERYIDHPDQLKFDFGDTDEAADAAEGLAEAIEESEIVIPQQRRKKQSRKPRNEQLPPHLERYEVIADVTEELRICAEHGERKLIGYDILESLEYIPPTLRVRVTKFPKYVCVNEPDCGVVEAPRPAGLVAGNRYDTSVAAEIVAGKRGYHLPIYRLEDYFAGSGWTPSRSTLLNVERAAAELIKPMIEHWLSCILSGGLVGTDETRVTLLLPTAIPEPNADNPRSQRIHEVLSKAVEQGKPSVSARMWVYRGVEVPLNVFDFTVSRHRDGPDEILVAGGFAGTVMADCYSGYQGLTLRSDERIVRAACMAHARRKVFEARESYPLLSSQLLAMFRQLYDIEDRARDMTPTDRQLLRDLEARPVLQRMRQLIDSEAAAKVLPKDQFAEALNYLRRQWDALQVYLTDGRLPIDNNDVEQLMKQIATGRKNWLFIGSVDAGERAALLTSLVSSALRNDLDVWAYVKDVLDQLLAGSTDYDSLRPDRWAVQHPEHIRVYRQQERRDRADAKRTRRQKRRAQANRRSG